ncbi:MAG: glycosyltransferase family 4 protein [Candidatus Altiarchaeia archaeon]
MKIAILVPNFTEYDGSARIAKEQAKDLLKEGNSVTIFTLNADMDAEGVDLVVMGMPKSLFWQRVYRLAMPFDPIKTLKWLPELKGFDRVIVHLYPLTWFGFLSKKIYGTHYTFWYHGIMDPQFFPRAHEKLYINSQIFLTKLTVKNADRSVAVSKYAQGEFKRYTGLESEIQYNKVDLKNFKPGIDGKPIREKYGLSDDPVILFVGALRPCKGVDLLIQAYKKVKERMPQVRLLIVGKPDYPYFYRKLKDMSDDSVTFVEYVQNELLPNYYSACDIYASCSLWEAHNVPVLEAQACGKFVVTFDFEFFKEEVDSNGTLVEKGNINKFAQACIDKLFEVRGDLR